MAPGRKAHGHVPPDAGHTAAEPECAPIRPILPNVGQRTYDTSGFAYSFEAAPDPPHLRTARAAGPLPVAGIGLP